MLQVQSPFITLTDTDGSPLDGGYVYIGTENLNPETSAIAVYWDYAGTQPAAQPLRTVNGYVARNGTPAQIYVSADNYSITARNSSSALVLYTLSVKASVITLADLADIATDKLIGRYTAGTGSPELITCTAAGRALLDDVDIAEQRTTLGLGTMAIQNLGAVSITGGTIGVSVTIAGFSAAGVYALIPTGSQVGYGYDFDATRTDIAVGTITPFPDDGTDPLITEGADCGLLVAHSAATTTNKLHIVANISARFPNDTSCGIAIFAGNTVVGTKSVASSGANIVGPHVVECEYTPGATTSINYTARLSFNDGGTSVYLNQNDAGNNFGSTHGSSITIREMKAV